DPLRRCAGVNVWSEARIRPGDNWREEIRRAIDQADVALLPGADFLASDFLQDVEVPQLFQRREEGGLRIVPVLRRDGKDAASFVGDQLDQVLAEGGKEIAGRAHASREHSENTRVGRKLSPPELGSGSAPSLMRRRACTPMRWLRHRSSEPWGACT